MVSKRVSDVNENDECRDDAEALWQGIHYWLVCKYSRVEVAMMNAMKCFVWAKIVAFLL